MSTNELQAKVKELKELKIMADELAAEIGSIEDELKAVMLSQGTDEIITGEYKIRYRAFTTSRFDTAAFRKSYAELYSAFSRQIQTKRFTIA